MIPQMMSAPPPPVLAQLSDLISFFRNMDQVGDLIKQLQAATEANNSSLELLEGAKTSSQAMADELAAKQKSLGNKEESLSALQASLLDKEKRLAESESNLQSAYINHQSRVAEFEASLIPKQAELDGLKNQLNAALAQAEADKADAAKNKETIQNKLAAVQAAAGV